MLSSLRLQMKTHCSIMLRGCHTQYSPLKHFVLMVMATQASLGYIGKCPKAETVPSAG